MFRTALVVATVVALSGCNVCQRIYNAEQSANDKGRDCGANANNLPNVNTCTNGLASCSQNDLQYLNSYADCLEKLSYCQDGQGFSWGLQRFGCIEPLGKVSGTCLQAIN
jgi:rubredoxin